MPSNPSITRKQAERHGASEACIKLFCDSCTAAARLGELRYLIKLQLHEGQIMQNKTEKTRPRRAAASFRPNTVKSRSRSSIVADVDLGCLESVDNPLHLLGDDI